MVTVVAVCDRGLCLVVVAATGGEGQYDRERQEEGEDAQPR